MSSPTEHTQVMASSLSRHRTPASAAAIMPSSSLTGMKAPESPPHGGGRHHAALLHRVVQEGQSGGGAVGAADLRPISSRIRATESPTAGGGRQGQVHDAEGGVQPAAGLPGATSWPMRVTRKAVFFTVSATTSKGAPFTLWRGVVHHAGTGDTHVDDLLRLAHAVEGAGHEGVGPPRRCRTPPASRSPGRPGPPWRRRCL